MKVKIGNKIYDSNDEAILLIFDEGEQELISNMGNQKKFLSYPESMTYDDAKEFMKTE